MENSKRFGVVSIWFKGITEEKMQKIINNLYLQNEKYIDGMTFKESKNKEVHEEIEKAIDKAYSKPMEKPVKTLKAFRH